MKLEIELDDQVAALLQAHADETGTDISSLVGSDRAVKDIVRDKMHQALGRELNDGKLPKSLVDSAVAHSLKIKEERGQAKARLIV